MAILDDLYYGRLNPIEKVCEDESFKKESKIYDEMYEKLRNSLSEKEKEKLLSLTDQAHILLGYEKEDSFKQGFAMAIRMITESNQILNDK